MFRMNTLAVRGARNAEHPYLVGDLHINSPPRSLLGPVAAELRGGTDDRHNDYGQGCVDRMQVSAVTTRQIVFQQ
jgi:hypothetical protein